MFDAQLNMEICCTKNKSCRLTVLSDHLKTMLLWRYSTSLLLLVQFLSQGSFSLSLTRARGRIIRAGGSIGRARGSIGRALAADVSGARSTEHIQPMEGTRAAAVSPVYMPWQVSKRNGRAAGL